MRTTSVDAGSGEFTWCIFLVLALLPLYPDISIIDPFHDSPYNFYFHNFGNRLTWPPRRLHPEILAVLTPLLCRSGKVFWAACYYISLEILFILKTTNQHVARNEKYVIKKWSLQQMKAIGSWTPLFGRDQVVPGPNPKNNPSPISESCLGSYSYWWKIVKKPSHVLRFKRSTKLI